MHFVKIYSGITESSITDLDVHVRWLWITMLTKADRYGNVYGTVTALARMANLSLEQVEDGIDKLMSPDPSSTTKDEDGRRVTQPSPNVWHIVSYLKYRNMRDPEATKEETRKRVANFRLRKSMAGNDVLDVTSGNADVTPGNAMQRQMQMQKKEVKEEGGMGGGEQPVITDPPGGSAGADAPPTPKKRFEPPTVDQVRAHCQEKGYIVDAEKFVAFYESKGWRVGNQSMKSWQAACVTWHRGNPAAAKKHVDSEADRRAKERAIRLAQEGL